MKLYIANGAPNCRRVQAVINHLGLENLETEWLDFFTGDLRTDEYSALNPNRKVPTLEDGSLKLWESDAIMQYLADTKEENDLFPKDPKSRADIIRWQFWGVGHYNKDLGVIAWESILKPEFGLGDPDQHQLNIAIENFKRYASILEKHLECRDFIVGENWTLADYAIGHMEMFIDNVPIDFTPYPNIVSFYKRLRDNSYWAETAPKTPEEFGRRPAAA